MFADKGFYAHGTPEDERRIKRHLDAYWKNEANAVDEIYDNWLRREKEKIEQLRSELDEQLFRERMKGISHENAIYKSVKGGDAL